MKAFCFVLAIIIYLQSVGQESLNKDSLLQLLPKAKEDSSKVLLLIQIGQQYEGSDPETAKQFYRQCRELSRRIGYRLGEIKFAANYTYVLNMQGHFDSSLQINLESVKVAKQLNNQEYIFKTLFNAGTSYRFLEDYESALRTYLEAYPIVISFNDDQLTGQALDIIQGLYTQLRQFRKSIVYGSQSVIMLRKTSNPVPLAMALSNLGMNYVSIRNFDSALINYQEALQLTRLAGHKHIESSVLLNIVDTYIKQFDYDKLEAFSNQALTLSKELQSYPTMATAYRALSYYYFFKRNYPIARNYADSSLKVAEKYGLKSEMQKTYAQLANISYALQDLRQGEWYSFKSGELADSILNETVQKRTIEMDKKYQTAIKDKQLALQQSDLKQKSTWNAILIGSVITILIFSVMAYLNYSNRRKLQQQRITELETEKQLAATAAVLKGEEQERTRLAKDLHDGLGGMLSGIKYSLHTMKGNLIMTPENALAFERSIDMLDSSISEMRRVAHNMMPEALLKFGLDTALRDFCNDINQSGALNVTYQSIGMNDVTIDQTKSVTVYRIVQELLNNIIKHAAAKNAIVQLTYDNGQISVTVEDDGKGFDPVILKGSKGIGWSNIQKRIAFLKGQWDVDSKEGEGSSVHVVIPN